MFDISHCLKSKAKFSDFGEEWKNIPDTSVIVLGIFSKPEMLSKLISENHWTAKVTGTTSSSFSS